MTTLPRMALPCLLLLGLVIPVDGQPGRRPVTPEVRGLLKAVEGTKSITLTVPEGRQPGGEKTYDLAKDVEVAHGTGLRRTGVFRAGKLADLKPGTILSLTLSADAKTVVSILAEEPSIRGILKSVDGQKNTLTLTLSRERGAEAGEEKTYTLAKDAEVAVDDGRGRLLSLKAAKLTDLIAGAQITLALSGDRQEARTVLAEGSLLNGIVKAVDATKNSITLVIGGRGGQGGDENTLEVAKDASVTIDDGRGRRLSLREAKLADIPVGAAVSVRLSANQNRVVSLRAEGPMRFGILKSVDPKKGTITFHLPVARGDNPEEKSLPVAADVRILIDGSETKLADIKIPADGLTVMLRLALDQQTVLSIVSIPGR